ncbi:hypothetical protein [Microcoleus sp. herbarium2]|uniref:hypothetical protein n=1 Tax=Microcoleus sp. herbarium2 TaxID=3055433 RepID=UPI002FD70FFC
MNFPAILDVVISLFFIYLILSLLASGLQEFIATVFEWRAKHLKEAIQILLGDNEANDRSAIQAKDIANKLWTHSLILSLNQRKKRKFLPPSAGPSYIPSKMFAATLLEILKKDYDFNPSETIDEIVESINNNKKLDQKIQERIYSIALIAQRTASGSESGIKSLEKEIIIWFDQSMERASGVYNRNVKGFAVLIGLVVTLALNADTFHILETLNRDAALRSGISLVASNVISNNKKQIDDCLIETKKMDDPRQKLTKQNQCFEAIYTGLDNIIMPLGWDTSNFPLSIQEQLAKQVNPLFPTTKVLSILGTIKLIFGWLLSAAAIGMGAPFWFDLLGKFINVRNAGQVPEPTSKD